MRRPLCLAGLAFVAAMLTAIPWISRGAPTVETLHQENVTALGRVAWKEYRTSGGEEVLTVSLEQVIVLKPDQISSLTQILSDSDTTKPNHIPADSMKRTKMSGIPTAASVNEIETYCRANKEKLQMADTEQITGILCYLEEGDPAMGSYVVVEGKFQAFAHATNPGAFDAADYYHIMGQQGRLLGSRCLAESEACDSFRERLYRLKE